MEATDSPLPSTAVPVPGYLIATTQLLCGASAVSRSKLLSLVAIAWGLYWLVKLARYPPAGDYHSVYLVGTQLFGTVMRILWANLIHDANDFKRKSDGKKKKDGGGESKRGWKQTILDALEVGFVANRGVGWNWQIKLPVTTGPLNQSRSTFVFDQLKGAAIRILIVDISSVYIRSTPLGTIPVTKGLLDEPLPVAFFRAWLIYLMGRWAIDSYYRVAAAVGVGLGIWDPVDWPPMFGSWWNAYTVRRFWAYTWHQLMRPVAQPPTNYLANLLHLPRNSKITFYSKVCGAFFFAYALHGYGSYLAGASHIADVYRYAPQVLAFAFEEFVIGLAKRVGVKGGSWARGLGYVWVFVFQGVTLVLWRDEAARLGAYARPAVFGFSFVEWGIKRFSWRG